MEVLFPGSSRVQQKFPLEFIELRDKTAMEIAALIVTPYRVIHASGAPPYALRVECAGKVITYSGDTEWTEALVHAAQGADLFICEAYFYEKKVKNHLDYRTLMKHWRELECGRLMLTHMSADMLNRLPEIDLEWAEDGKRIEL